MRRAVVLACGLLYACGGCRSQKAAAPPLTPVTVRLDALLPLHPAWADVKRLDALTAQSAGLATGAAPNRMGLPSGMLPKPLPPSVVYPPRTGRVSAAIAPALDRIAGLKTRMTENGQRVLRREREAAERELDVDVATHQARLLSNQPEQERAARAGLDRQIRDLEIHIIALQSQVRVISGPLREQARQKIAKYQAQIAALQPQIPERIAAVRAKTQQAVEAYRRERAQEVATRMAERSAELAGDADRRIAQYRAQLTQSLPSFAVSAMGPAMGAAAIEDPGLPPPSAVAENVYRQPAGGDASRSKAVTSLAAQRSRLVAYIADDIRRRLEPLAARRGWQLQTGPRADARDVTADAANALTRQFAK